MQFNCQLFLSRKRGVITSATLFAGIVRMSTVTETGSRRYVVVIRSSSLAEGMLRRSPLSLAKVVHQSVYIYLRGMTLVPPSRSGMRPFLLWLDTWMLSSARYLSPSYRCGMAIPGATPSDTVYEHCWNTQDIITLRRNENSIPLDRPKSQGNPRRLVL